MVAVYGCNSNRKSIAADENPDYIQSIPGYRTKGLDGAGVAEKLQFVRKVWAFCHYGDEAEAPFCSRHGLDSLWKRKDLLAHESDLAVPIDGETDHVGTLVQEVLRATGLLAQIYDIQRTRVRTEDCSNYLES